MSLISGAMLPQPTKTQKRVHPYQLGSRFQSPASAEAPELARASVRECPRRTTGCHSSAKRAGSLRSAPAKENRPQVRRLMYGPRFG